MGRRPCPFAHRSLCQLPWRSNSLSIDVEYAAANRCRATRGCDPGRRRRSAPVRADAHRTADVQRGFAPRYQLEAVCDDCTDRTLGAHVDLAQANLVTQTNSSGLGTRFNGDQCTVCHNHPALGGSGGFMVPNPQDPPARYQPPENPDVNLIPHRKGGTNYVPSFITRFGPIREVRFALKPDGRPDGGVHQLFTVVGRSDIFAPWQSGSCTTLDLAQPDFETENRKGNLRFEFPAALRARHSRWHPGSRDSPTSRGNRPCQGAAGHRRHPQPQR